MSDLIDRRMAIKAIEDLPNCHNGYSDTYDKACIIGVLEQVPSAQPERKTGHWLVKQDRNGSTYGECSQCHSIQYAGHTPYCPTCGAYMRGEQDE